MWWMQLKPWMRRVRGAIGMGVVWAIGWAATGLLIGAASVLLPGLPWNRFFAVFDAPLPAMGVPGFVGGVLFSLVLGVAAHRRRLNELSLIAVTVWGALGGLLLSLVPSTLTSLGLVTVRIGQSNWKLAAVIAPPLVILCAASAAGSLIVARAAERRVEASETPEVEYIGQRKRSSLQADKHIAATAEERAHGAHHRHRWIFLPRK